MYIDKPGTLLNSLSSNLLPVAVVFSHPKLALLGVKIPDVENLSFSSLTISRSKLIRIILIVRWEMIKLVEMILKVK